MTPFHRIHAIANQIENLEEWEANLLARELVRSGTWTATSFISAVDAEFQLWEAEVLAD